MSSTESKVPVYDDRVKRILSYLEQGLSREDVAEKFQYNSYRSMEMYMARRNFKWDKRAGTYVSALASDKQETPIQLVPSDKVRRVIAELGKGEVDLKEVAKKVGFESHKEMAIYMKSKGYEWSQEAGNYVFNSSTPTAANPSDTSGGIDTNEVPSYSGGHADTDAFLPLLEWLAANKDALQSLLGESVALGQIPRFTLPGLFVTKSVHMTNTLDQMVRDFSKEKNINQREIFEVALIEFFRKYGFAREVETLLRSNA
jgi:hypothetical protein